MSFEEYLSMSFWIIKAYTHSDKKDTC